jgi:hypothetical protein
MESVVEPVIMESVVEPVVMESIVEPVVEKNSFSTEQFELQNKWYRNYIVACPILNQLSNTNTNNTNTTNTTNTNTNINNECIRMDPLVFLWILQQKEDFTTKSGMMKYPGIYGTWNEFERQLKYMITANLPLSSSTTNGVCIMSESILGKRKLELELESGSQVN